MFTIGVTQYGKRGGTAGYVYGKGGQQRGQAMAMDMRGFDAPQYDFLAFPGEELPQIECNEQEQRLGAPWPSRIGTSLGAAARVLVPSIHRSAWKGSSRKFVPTR
jgi:hypothetical protein